MTWTYTAGWLSGASSATVSMTKARLLVGDTISTNQQLQDEEIFFILGVQPIHNYAAADLADILSARYAFQVNTDNSLLRVSAAARSKAFADLAKRLRAAGPGSTPGGESAGAILATGYAGGTSRSEVDSLRADADNVLPDVAIGQDDFERTANSDPDNYFSD